MKNFGLIIFCLGFTYLFCRPGFWMIATLLAIAIIILIVNTIKFNIKYWREYFSELFK